MKILAILFCFATCLVYCSGPAANNEAEQQLAVTDTVLVKGKTLFTTQCASCHMVNKEMTGPALKGVEDRWPDTIKLYAFIRNSQQVIKEDKYAHELWLTFNQTIMPEHKDLSDDDIQAILYYIRSVSEAANP
jgi:cytochrome c2